MFADQYLPTRRGFESHYGYYQGAEDYYDHTYEYDTVYAVIDSGNDIIHVVEYSLIKALLTSSVCLWKKNFLWFLSLNEPNIP